MLRVADFYSLLPLNLEWQDHNIDHRVMKQELYYFPALFMGWGVVERHLVMDVSACVVSPKIYQRTISYCYMYFTWRLYLWWLYIRQTCNWLVFQKCNLLRLRLVIKSSLKCGDSPISNSYGYFKVIAAST